MAIDLAWDYLERTNLIEKCISAVNKGKSTSMILNSSYVDNGSQYIKINIHNYTDNKDISFYLTFTEIKKVFIKHHYTTISDDLVVNVGEFVKLDPDLEYSLCQLIVQRIWGALKIASKLN